MVALKVLRSVVLVGVSLLQIQCANTSLPETWRLPEVKIPVVKPSELVGGSESPCDPSIVPRQSPNARECLYLASNENCEFFVDGQSMIKGKRVRVLVTNESHRVVCKPTGHRAKEDKIDPPFDPYFPVSFTFLLEDKLSN